MTMKSRVGIYARISKDKIGAGLGAERQEADCRALVDRLDGVVADVYVDNDTSAYSGKPRPEYLRMLEDIRAGKLDTVVAWHTDRLHRSPRELEDYITACESGSVPTHCVTAGDLDLSTASGRMTARITGAVARHESEHASERIRAQKTRAAASGQWTGGGRPFGYTADGSDIVADEADAIRDGVRRVVAGESVYSVMKDWQQRGIKPVRSATWRRQNVQRTLTNPRYAGHSVRHGEIVGSGTWPAIITEDEHAAVSAILKDPKRNSYQGVRSLKWLGSGLYRCGVCGSDLRSATGGTKPDGTWHCVYRCRLGKHVAINADPLDRYVAETTALLLNEEGTNLLPNTNRERVAELREQAMTLRARLDEVADAFGDGDLTRAQYNRQRQRIEGKIETVDGQLASMLSGSVLDGVADAENPGAAFRELPVARRRAIVDALEVITIGPSAPGGLPKGKELDYTRVHIDRREVVDNE